MPTHLVVQDKGRERDALAVNVRLDERKCAADAVERDVREPEVRRHVDEVRPARHELSVACQRERRVSGVLLEDVAGVER